MLGKLLSKILQMERLSVQLRLRLPEDHKPLEASAFFSMHVGHHQSSLHGQVTRDNPVT